MTTRHMPMTDDRELTIKEMTAILRQRFEGITDDQREAIAASIKRIVREYAAAGAFVPQAFEVRPGAHPGEVIVTVPPTVRVEEVIECTYTEEVDPCTP